MYSTLNYLLLDLCADNIDNELMRRGIVFLHGKALDNTRIGMMLVLVFKFIMIISVNRLHLVVLIAMLSFEE